MRRLLLAAALWMTCLVPVARPAAAHGSQDDSETIVFLGDSITWQNYYPLFVESYFLRRRPASENYRFVNLGVRGDTTEATLARLDRDLGPLGADVVFVLLGMNDGGYGGVNAFLLRYYLGFMEELIGKIEREYGSRVVLLTPTRVAPVDHDRRRYNRMLRLMADGLADLGQQRGLSVIRLFDLFEEAWPAAGSREPPVELMADAVHPGPAGHLLIAERILGHLLPGKVPAPKALSFDLTRAKWKDGRTAVEFSHPHDNIFLPHAAAVALDLPPTRGYFASRRLVIEGLDGNVRLRAGGANLGVFTARALEEGIDIDRRPKTPWAREAYRLYELLSEKWRLRYYLWDPQDLGVDAWRSVYAPGRKPLDKQEAFRRLEQVLDELKELPEPAAKQYELVIERID